MHSRASRHGRRGAWAVALAALLGTAVVVGCGGGTSASLATAASYTQGPITGFGSVIVNGVRFDDSAASVEDEDGVSHSSAELKLGTTVEVDGSAVDHASGRALAKALRIRFGAEIVGPVAGVDTTASTLVALGQTVDVKPTTVFADELAGGLAAMTAGTVVGVHAQFDAATGHYVATRIDARPDAPVYRLRGQVGQLDATAKTFHVGGAVISYASATEVPADLADGMRVRVRLQKTQVNGQWVALTVRHGMRRVDDMDGADLRGIVSAFTSSSQFDVNGIHVDASGAQFPDGSAGVVLGARVEVEGRISNGTLVATKVELDDDSRQQRHLFELHGALSSLNATAKTFVLRGVSVDYSGSAIVYVGGSAADLADGRNVEVVGVLSADGHTLVAKAIKFES